MSFPEVRQTPQLQPKRLRRKERYELRESVGKGSTGTVYRALDRELNRTVAVKVLHPELVTGLGYLLRLKREAVLASRINNEHVVRVYDIGQTDGRMLIAMDWIDGESLAHLLDRAHLLPPTQVVDIAKQICLGIKAIHEAHVVHRDLKPANLLLLATSRGPLRHFNPAHPKSLILCVRPLGLTPYI